MFLIQPTKRSLTWMRSLHTCAVSDHISLKKKGVLHSYAVSKGEQKRPAEWVYLPLYAFLTSQTSVLSIDNT